MLKIIIKKKIDYFTELLKLKERSTAAKEKPTHRNHQLNI